MCRYRILRVSAELFLSCYTEGLHKFSYRVVGDALPADAKCVNVRHAFPNEIELVIESESFPEIRRGEQLLVMVPQLSIASLKR